MIKFQTLSPKQSSVHSPIIEHQRPEVLQEGNSIPQSKRNICKVGYTGGDMTGRLEHTMNAMLKEKYPTTPSIHGKLHKQPEKPRHP